MELLWWIVGMAWVIGWVKELAYVGAKMKANGISYPHDGVKYVMPFVLFVTWPYFYFYGKAL